MILSDIIMFKIIITIIVLVILIPLLILLWHGLKAWAIVFIGVIGMCLYLWECTWWSAKSRADHYNALRREIEDNEWRYYR